ncbi:MAG: hypothetical protein HY925_01945 [Elusimicrobia bacterium]|nr:hypothetical protein [Elusimicrobiota bacterium]
MKLSLLAVLLLSSTGAFADERYVVKDEGMFAPTGRHVEFPDRFGWRGYEAKLDFKFDSESRRMSPDSVLNITVHKSEGGNWSYRCRARDSKEMFANVNFIYGRGILVVVQCRVNPDKFADAVNLDSDMVGEPTLVFSAWIREGKAEVGTQKGFYFQDGGQMRSSVMAQYASQNDDPTDLAVQFATTETLAGGAKPWQAGVYRYQPMPRFVP